MQEAIFAKTIGLSGYSIGVAFGGLLLTTGNLFVVGPEVPSSGFVV